MSAKLSKDVFIVASKRTAFGTFGGSLKDKSAVELGAVAAKGALSQIGSGAADLVDSICIGNVAQSTTDCAYLARHVGLKAGVPLEKPALTINRLCGSGFQTIVTGCQEIELGVSNVVLTGGAESMSLAPHLLHGLRFGVPLGQAPPMKDSLWETLTDYHVSLPMSMTAENLADKCNVTKEESDEIALMSQQRWKAAQDKGIFKEEIEPMTITVKRKEVTFDTDEHPRPQSTAESLAKLRPLFRKDGRVSAGNASGISDGAGAVVIAGEEAVKANNLKPLAKVVGYSVVGVPPEIMGYGPVPAIQNALKATGLTLNDMDRIEVNEAFACQFAACQKDLGLDMTKTNVNGGAVAIGHPTGASGSRIMGHLAYELQRINGKYAIGAACIGGGQGIAVILERC